MKKSLLFLILLLAVFLSGCGITRDIYCPYEEFEAVITINSIERQPGNLKSPESPQEMLFVNYSFDSQGHAPPPVTTISGKLQLKREDIEKKEIKIGDQYRTPATFTEKKVCSPGPFIEGFDKWKKIE
jgi:hypothetical protein